MVKTAGQAQPPPAFGSPGAVCCACWSGAVAMSRSYTGPCLGQLDLQAKHLGGLKC